MPYHEKFPAWKFSWYGIACCVMALVGHIQKNLVLMDKEKLSCIKKEYAV